MTHVHELLSDQLLANANDPSFYLPFSHSVENLTDEEAFWKPSKECHCIAEIVQHLLYWNETWQRRFTDSSFHAVQSPENNDESFNVSENVSFKEIKERLLEVLLNWQNILSEERVQQDVNDFPVQAKWWEILGNITTHNAYHIGQIIYIRKLKQNWKND